MISERVDAKNAGVTLVWFSVYPYQGVGSIKKTSQPRGGTTLQSKSA